MRIGNELLKKAVFGAVKIWEEDGTLRLCRFTDRQLAYFDETLNYVEKPKKSRASAGMQIDFWTDSEKLRMEFACFIGSSQSICYVDVYVDGVMRVHDGYEQHGAQRFSVDVQLGEGRKRVTVYLPCLFGTSIVSAELDDGAEFTPAEKKEKFLFVGDSITQGYIALFPSLTYPNILCSEMDAECLNQGIGGAYFLAEDLDEDLPYAPDRVFVAYGTNDWSRNREVAANADRYLQKLCAIYPEARIYVILPIWRGKLPEKEKTTKQTFLQMQQGLRAVCEKYANVRVIDGLSLVPHETEFFVEDQLHPNDLGFTQYAKMLERAVRKVDKNG